MTLKDALDLCRNLRKGLGLAPDEPPLPEGYIKTSNYLWVSKDGAHVVVGPSLPLRKQVRDTKLEKLQDDLDSCTTEFEDTEP